MYPTTPLPLIGRSRSRPNLLVLAVTVLVPMLGACTEQQDAAELSGPDLAPAFARGGNGGNNGRILFRSDRHNPGSEKMDLYSMNPDGSGVTRLTSDPGTEGYAAWSPDGKKIAFTSDRDDPSGEIYVMNADGTGVTRLTFSTGYDVEPRWSKDGKRIVFVTTRFAANPDSPASNELEIMTMNADGTGLTRLTSNAAGDAGPDWSSDGKRIVFSSNRADPNADVFDIFVMNPDGTNVTQLTVGGILNLWPVWAPGGKQIAFNGVDGINVMNADGTNRTLIAPGNDIEALPFWSDDGKYIVFNQDVGGNREIFVMNADGTNMTRLTFSQGADVAVAWRR